MAGVPGLEPATSAVTGQRSEPIELHPRPSTAETLNRKLKARVSVPSGAVVGAKGLEPLTPSV